MSAAEGAQSAHAYEPSEPDFELILTDRWEHEHGYPEEQIRAAEDEADRERDRQQEDVDWSEGRRREVGRGFGPDRWERWGA